MTTTVLGNFKRNGDGFAGTIHTLAFKAQIELVPLDGTASEAAPAYRVYHAKREIGAAWIKRARKSDAEFLSLKLSDLAFGPEPIYPALVQSTSEKDTWTLLLNGRETA